ncbi:uncharacterized protein TNCT_107861 [Trichonephila clavata]|uniref:Uncharacterized protein n=1 Tax=Trichonephila clavata TaxID=2740835 RepID=A0A8X6I0H7_TRICU|nr:uncharacterized protein TNCT_107861 [Trichonephila clavata]
MAYLGKGRREDLFVLATELNLKHDKSMTIATLKNLITGSEGYEAPRKFEYNRTDKKFPASANFNKHYEAPVTKYENVQRYQDNAQKGYYNKNYEKHPNHNATKHAQTNYSKSQKYRERPKETCTLVVKEGLRTKEIFFGKKKITALIDSGSTDRCSCQERKGPLSAISDAFLQRTEEAIRANRRLNLKELHQIIPEVSITTLYEDEVVTVKLGYRKLCERWAPKNVNGRTQKEKDGLCTRLPHTLCGSR